MYTHDIKHYRKYYQQKRRLTVLRAYSNGTPHCACCGETFIEFLAIDHVSGNGSQERKAKGTKIGGYALYNRLIRNKFPQGYRVLCHNCNQALGFYGYCPHTIQTLHKLPTQLTLFEVN